MLRWYLKYPCGIFVLLTFTTFVECNDIQSRSIFMESMRKLLLKIKNHPNLTWVPELPIKFISYHDVSVLLGTVRSSDVYKRKVKVVNYTNDSEQIPKTFDSRTQWKKCPSIGMIRDQSSCASSWAFGTVETIADRICIKSKQKLNITLSAMDVISCCSDCGFGCYGGLPFSAWTYWLENGIVTGGSNESQDGCKPYPFAIYEHNKQVKYRTCDKIPYDTPNCTKKCQSSYKKSYFKDKYFGKSFYLVFYNQTDIQREIMKHGPVQATFRVFEDFFLYKSGIYQHIHGDEHGTLAIKIIGWGETNGTPYWLCVNSWNEDWGEKGLFKILRGQNHCEIEREVHGGIPGTKKK